MAMFTLTPEYPSECNSAEKEEREASAKLRETLGEIWEINTKLQPSKISVMGVEEGRSPS